ncbi:MAG: metallophosphoesterase [Thermodesulfobacteriota bacterium]
MILSPIRINWSQYTIKKNIFSMKNHVTKTMRTFAIGDIHGKYRAFCDVLEKAHFDNEEDVLIFLGDMFDNYTGHFVKCVDRFIEIKKRVWIRGNHDQFVLKWFRGEWRGDDHIWLSQGGNMTKKDYLDEEGNLLVDVVKKHHEELEKSVLYHIDPRGNLYVHGGIDWSLPIDEQDEETYFWDRDTFLIEAPRHAKNGTKFPYRAVFIGHTPTNLTGYGYDPVNLANLWNLNTGSTLTIMDVDTFEYWQSGLPEIEGKSILTRLYEHF